MQSCLTEASQKPLHQVTQDGRPTGYEFCRVKIIISQIKFQKLASCSLESDITTYTPLHSTTIPYSQIKIENNSITDLILYRPTTYDGRTRSEVQTTSNHVRETKNQKEPIRKQL